MRAHEFYLCGLAHFLTFVCQGTQTLLMLIFLDLRHRNRSCNLEFASGRDPTQEATQGLGYLIW